MKKFFGKIVRAVALTGIVAVISFAQSVTSNDGVLKDPRDGKTYRTVKIGNQVWMAENLNFKNKGSSCFDKKQENCDKYGRLYTWKAAQKACPAGWHLPKRQELDALMELAQKTASDESKASAVLKSKTGWTNHGKKDESGDDLLGFNALPVGYMGDEEEGNSPYISETYAAFFWSSTSDKDYNPDAYRLGLFYGDVHVAVGPLPKYYGMSVRCLKN